MSKIEAVDVRIINAIPSKNGRVESALNAIINPSSDISIDMPKQSYTYRTDMELQEDDIVLVEALGTLVLAKVVNTYEKSNMNGKRVLAKIEFAKNFTDNSLIIQEMIMNMNKEMFEYVVLNAAKSINNDKMKDLVSKYYKSNSLPSILAK